MTDTTNIDITEVVDESPIVMTISAFSNIQQRLKFLSAIMRTKEESDSRVVRIESYRREMKTDSTKTESVVRFTIDSDVWCEINTLKRVGGDILPKCISVNLYSLFNMLDNSREEMVSMWIDDDTNELVVNSFYNPDLDRDELEIRLPIIDSWVDPIINIDDRDEPSSVILLSPITTFSALKELNIENKTDYIQFIVTDGKLSLASEYHGIITHIEPNEFVNDDFGNMKSFALPFGLFYLMSSTGQVDVLRLEVHDGYVYLHTDDYGFRYQLVDVDLVNMSELSTNGMEKIFIIDSDQGFATIEKVTNLNCVSDYTEITYEKIANGLADFSANIEGKIKIYATAILATLSDVKVQFDGNVFRDMFTKNGVDVLAVNQLPGGRLYIGYTNAAVTKSVYYDHTKFMKYRTQK